MTRGPVFLGALGLVAFLTAPALANEPALAIEAEQVVRGEALAKRWCVSCHVIGPDVQGGDAGPPFTFVANREGADAGMIESWLADPHPAMPDPGLAKPEYQDIAAYIMSLKP